jgi:hypothetical protein
VGKSSTRVTTSSHSARNFWGSCIGASPLTASLSAGVERPDLSIPQLVKKHTK